MNSIHFHFNGDVNINLSLPDIYPARSTDLMLPLFW